jgi:DnaJ-domain-containing protein 1
MHDHPKGEDDDPVFATNREEDDREQEALLHAVLEFHPATMTQDELVRELSGGRPKEFFELDRVQRAIRELAAAGLLHRPGEDETVRPTRAALRCAELTEAAS